MLGRALLWTSDLKISNLNQLFGKFLKLTLWGGGGGGAKTGARHNINNWRILIRPSSNPDPQPSSKMFPGTVRRPLDHYPLLSINAKTTVCRLRDALFQSFLNTSWLKEYQQMQMCTKIVFGLTNSLSESVCWGG